MEVIDPAEMPEWEQENLDALRALAAKPWRGACPLCIDRLWSTDTEEEAARAVGEHIAKEHDLRPQVWKRNG